MRKETKGLALLYRIFVLLLVSVGLLSVTGCGLLSKHPPQNLPELEAFYADGSSYGLAEIVDHNLRRVLNQDLGSAPRLASLSVIIHMEGCTPLAMKKLSLVLDNPATPVNVRRAVVGVLAGNDQPGIGGYVEAELARPGDVRLKNTLLDWITRHPSEEMLDDVIRLWAESDVSDESVEKRYKRAVETIACRTWPDALLEVINADRFSRRASALKILNTRMSSEMLQERLEAILPNSLAMSALRYYSTELQTILTADNFLPSVEVYVSDRTSLAAVATVVRKWGKQESYSFSPADIHLLKYLSGAADDISDRSSLVDALASSVADSEDRQSLANSKSLLAKLDRADLHRVSLLLRWLNDPETRRRLNIAARRDREDSRVRWGGLVFVNNSGPEAFLYPPAEQGSDLTYVPSARFRHDASDCLCWFVCDFISANHVSPAEDELERARKLELPGVVLFGKGQDYFSAVFFTESGVIIPLGVFQFAI